MKSFLMDSFCNPSSERPKRVLIATSSGDCGINCTTCTAVLHDGFPCNLLEFSQKMGRAGRSNIVYNNPPVECTFVLSIEHFVTLYVRYQKIEISQQRNKNIGDLKSMMKLMLFPTKCIHKHLEDEFNECGDDGRTVVISDPCSKCWYCSRAYTNIKHPIRSIDKDGTINVLESIFLRQNGSPIHATKLPKMINDHQHKQKIWKLATKPSDVENSYAHSLVLSLIAVGMLDPKMMEVNDGDGKPTEKMILMPAQNDDGVLWKSPLLWNELIGS